MAKPVNNADVSTIDFDRLHRVHATPTSGNSLDLAGARWRPTGSATMEQNQKVAYRMALCWNVLEGIPNAALDAGVLRELHEVSWQLVDAHRARSPVEALLGRLAELMGTFDRQIDLTDGRLTDCPCAIKEQAATVEQAPKEQLPPAPAPPRRTRPTPRRR